MSTPKPGQIRCPTCHRSTAPAAFCTHCGAAIPSSAVTRPRGMDRSELDSRIRSRRTDQTYRRGGYADEWAGGYEPFEPEPEDALAIRGEGEAPPPHVDHSDEGRGAAAAGGWPAQDDLRPPAPPQAAQPPATDPWRRGRDVSDEPEAPRGPEQSIVPPIVPVPPVAAEPHPPATARPDPWAARSVEPPPPIEDAEYGAADDEGWPADEPYYVPSDDYDDRRGGGVLPIIGFAALGVIALLIGVFMSGLLGRDEPVARVTPTPIAASPTPAATASQTAAATASPAATQSGQPNASEGPPITFPDGFVATTQPCSTQPDASGCNSDGATNDGDIWVYIGFEQGQREDVIGMTILDSSGGNVAQASIELERLGCPAGGGCRGWILFPGFGTPYSDLGPGDYRIRINRNGLPAAEADFTVT